MEEEFQAKLIIAFIVEVAKQIAKQIVGQIKHVRHVAKPVTWFLRFARRIRDKRRQDKYHRLSNEAIDRASREIKTLMVSQRLRERRSSMSTEVSWERSDRGFHGLSVIFSDVETGIDASIELVFCSLGEFLEDAERTPIWKWLVMKEVPPHNNSRELGSGSCGDLDNAVSSAKEIILSTFRDRDRYNELIGEAEIELETMLQSPSDIGGIDIHDMPF